MINYTPIKNIFLKLNHCPVHLRLCCFLNFKRFMTTSNKARHNEIIKIIRKSHGEIMMQMYIDLLTKFLIIFTRYFWTFAHFRHILDWRKKCVFKFLKNKACDSTYHHGKKNFQPTNFPLTPGKEQLSLITIYVHCFTLSSVYLIGKSLYIGFCS